MIQAEDFINEARSLGFNTYSGVPCSFLTPFINHVLNSDNLTYIGAANEGDAVATAAGMTLGGNKTIVMLQNSGLGNAVNPITSLLHTFKLPVLFIITLRGDPDFTDEPQHEMMGQITKQMLELMGINWEYFPDTTDKIRSSLDTAHKHILSTHRSYALIMKKGSVKSEPLYKAACVNHIPENSIYQAHDLSPACMQTRHEVLRTLQEDVDVDNAILLASTGYTGRELYALNDRCNQLYMVGSMGCASSLGLGLSMALPDKTIIVIEGDGAALMRMGNIATIGQYAEKNFLHIILDNEMHDSTGGQATVSAGVNFAQIANACGYAASHIGTDPKLMKNLINDEQTMGPRMLHLKIKPGTMNNLPRPNELPYQVARRLMNYLGTSL